MAVSDSLPVRNRPRAIKDLVGQEYAKTVLKGDLRKDTIPRAILIGGPTGIGKTTLARILATTLNCQKRKESTTCLSRKNPKEICNSCKFSLKGNHPDILENNTADARGIDDMRQLVKLAAYLPTFNYRVIIMDECFAPSTQISVPRGISNIEDVAVGDTVYNMEGLGTVVHTFKTMVPLSRVVRLDFTDGTTTFCSQDHEYFMPGTENKTQAKNLLGHIINSRLVRVKNVTFYKRGCNDKDFSGIIEDQERNQGYCIFHDLQIESHHSYYANGHLVSNCQQLTPAGAQLLLKPLEEPPANTVWILPTMEPDKVPEAIRNRCKYIPLSPIDKTDLVSLMQRVSKKEGYELGEKIVTWIASISNSRPRDALNILDSLFSIMSCEDIKELDELPESMEQLIVQSGIIGNEPIALVILSFLYIQNPLVYTFLQRGVTDSLIRELYYLQDSFVAHMAFGNKSWRWRSVIKLVTKVIKTEVNFNAYSLPVKYHIALSALLGKAVILTRQYGDPGIALRQVISEWFLLNIDRRDPGIIDIPQQAIAPKNNKKRKKTKA